LLLRGKESGGGVCVCVGGGGRARDLGRCIRRDWKVEVEGMGLDEDKRLGKRMFLRGRALEGRGL
jgi:hypothetical protein